MKRTLFEKIWEQHVVQSIEQGPDVFYIDRHFIHEVTSPQAFAGLDRRGIKVRRPDRVTATADHNVPTLNQHLPIEEPLSRKQVEALEVNCRNHGIELYGLNHERQGIVHVIGPELGLTQPGMTIVCGDSHTSTHGAFGTIAFGIGTSEVEMVLATQCLLQYKPKTMLIRVEGECQSDVSAKDIILYIIAQLGTGGGAGYFVEYAGEAIRALSMEGRMTVCNMSIEMGARGGMIAPDETTFNYLRGKPFAPSGLAFDQEVEHWQALVSDEGASYDNEVVFQAENIRPMITFGTNPGMGIPILDSIPMENDQSLQKALQYMDFNGGDQMVGKRISHVFIGSCTNGRIEDLRVVANAVKGKKKADHVTVWIVPGSKQVEAQAKAEGIEEILKSAGFELRQPGCSACLAMNEDKIPAGAYCVSTSNRNFEGRQGPGARTILASPRTAALAAIHGAIAVEPALA